MPKRAIVAPFINLSKKLSANFSETKIKMQFRFCATETPRFSHLASFGRKNEPIIK